MSVCGDVKCSGFRGCRAVSRFRAEGGWPHMKLI